LEEAAALDCTIEEMCFYAGISKPTYYAYLEADHELSARLEALRNEPILAARQTIIKALKTNPQQANWYLERKRKKEFAERKEVTGADGAPLFDEETKRKADAAISGYLGNPGQGDQK
jgi:hypothetical protein